MSDGEDPTKHSTPVDYDSQAVDYEPSSDEDASGSEEDAKTSTTSKPPSPVRSFSQRTLQCRADQEKRVPLSSRRLRHMEAQTKHFLTKTMDDTHIRLVKNLTTAYDIFQAICKKYEGATFHGDPYFILHFLMETKYEEGSNVNELFLVLEDAMRAASKATESVLTDGQSLSTCSTLCQRPGRMTCAFGKVIGTTAKNPAMIFGNVAGCKRTFGMALSRRELSCQRTLSFVVGTPTGPTLTSDVAPAPLVDVDPGRQAVEVGPTAVVAVTTVTTARDISSLVVTKVGTISLAAKTHASLLPQWSNQSHPQSA
ncbi:unnamed protein product [Phytophthora fragariaefolia]|uniref:Unnamed protein product n=1 Tax=Phytophthora fragariaefolia TaxID=1490495 RepID=A0A9W6YM55_9STRA|nr:unnamed protein product [Phytophthora fragariaefolia]